MPRYKAELSHMLDESGTAKLAAMDALRATEHMGYFVDSVPDGTAHFEYDATAKEAKKLLAALNKALEPFGITVLQQIAA